jgi:Transposase
LATPGRVNLWIGLDVGKEEHFAEVLDDDGDRLFAESVVNCQEAPEALMEKAGTFGTIGLVIDQPGSTAQLALAVARQRGAPVAYVPGLVMRRAPDLYPVEAKTDQRDAYLIVDKGRTRRRQVHWLDAGSDELPSPSQLSDVVDCMGFDVTVDRLGYVSTS